MDGLHQATGSRHVVEVHRSVRRHHCMNCGRTYGLELVLAERVPHCPVCGGSIRPDGARSRRSCMRPTSPPRPGRPRRRGARRGRHDPERPPGRGHGAVLPRSRPRRRRPRTHRVRRARRSPDPRRTRGGARRGRGRRVRPRARGWGRAVNDIGVVCWHHGDGPRTGLPRGRGPPTATRRRTDVAECERGEHLAGR
ncbi:Sir2 family NAD-dependent protein deacetylase [Mobilicoccus pelagius]|uniref:Sir2 family NAD-dependent protein deacetylase n=1 Tax=Mobilicoccus pelagius TaxID=746032 RepID=UPI001146C9C8